ncbi:MAG: response regulator PleD [Thermodesulfobacteriota bacterium]
MNIIENKILVMAKPESKTIIEKSLKNISDITIFEADSENKAFELIYKHIFILVIIDETLPNIDIYKIGTMLLSHKETYNAPLLIITDTIKPENFLKDFKKLQVDYIQKPFTGQFILAKLRIFFELFKQKNAVDQSIDELDKVYKKIIDQHELDMEKEDSKKELINISSIAANQMQQPLQNLQGNIYQLIHTKGISQKTKSSITSIKTSTERILQISKKLNTLPGKTNQALTKAALDLNADKAYKILYVENHDEDFNIFDQLIRSVLRCELIRAKTIEHGMELIADSRFDLIFITHILPDGEGFDMVAKLDHLHLDTPTVFTLNKANIHKGAKAIAKGAFAFFAKEDISSKNILSIIDLTLRKAMLTREVKDARNRIVLISRRDHLTKLFNRACFEQEIESETLRAKRYETELSILIVDFDKFKQINQIHGYNTGDVILTTSAALIQGMVRNSDIVCRYGGKEFGIILPNTGLNGAKILAQRIRKRIADHEFEKASKKIKLTVSLGIALYDPDRDTAFGLLVKKALNALTSAADEGGNQIRTLV